MKYAVRNFAVKHLEPRFYGALWFAGAGVMVAMSILTIMDRAKYKEEITLLAALLALVLATIGWLWSGRMGVLMARKTNALALLERLSSGEVNVLKEKIYPYIEAYDKFKREDDCENRPAMPEWEIQRLLGVYEQASLAVIHGAVDPDIIRLSQGLVFKRIYRGLCHHIERVQEKNPDYFINFEKVTCTWNPELQKRATLLSNPGGLFSPMKDADA